MFPSINNTMGIDTCKAALDLRPDLNPRTSCIIDAVTLVLENNISYFNNRIYKQVSGTAMGPNHACSYAGRTHPLEPLTNLSCLISHLTRFRDDIFAIWEGSVESLNSFTWWLNTLMPGIPFKLESKSYDQVDNLDGTIFKHVKHGGKLLIKIYSKPTYTHACMSPDSCHLQYIGNNILYGVALHCRRLTMQFGFGLYIWYESFS